MPSAASAPPEAEQAREPARGSYLQSLQRGILVLDLISASAIGMSARELAEAANLDRTVTHRVIRTLERDELLVKQNNRFVLGPRALLLGNRYLAQSPLRAAALPFLIDLQRGSFAGRPWRVAVLAPAGTTMTLVAESWSSTTPLDTLPGILNRPIDEAVTGRCMLAYMPQTKVTSIIGEPRAAELAPRLAAIRQSGGIDYESATDKPPGIAPGLSSVAAAIRRRDGHPAGGLIVSGTDMEHHASRDSEVAHQLLRTAKQIGSVLL